MFTWFMHRFNFKLWKIRARKRLIIARNCISVKLRIFWCITCYVDVSEIKNSWNIRDRRAKGLQYLEQYLKAGGYWVCKGTLDLLSLPKWPCPCFTFNNRTVWIPIEIICWILSSFVLCFLNSLPPGLQLSFFFFFIM